MQEEAWVPCPHLPYLTDLDLLHTFVKADRATFRCALEVQCRQRREFGEFFIASRYCGPSDSGNGGCVCGLLARELEGQSEVTLRRPPPLDTAMAVARTEEGGVRLMDGGTLVAEAGPIEPLALDIIPAPTLAEARACSRRYIGHQNNAFPRCYVCGPERREDGGMCIFPGPFPGALPGASGEHGAVASPWTPSPETAGPDGIVAEAFVWAALDCPGGIAVMGDRYRPYVLGRFAAHLLRPLHLGRDYVVAGWPLASDGRKHFAATAVFDETRAPAAFARATWIAQGEA